MSNQFQHEIKNLRKSKIDTHKYMTVHIPSLVQKRKINKQKSYVLLILGGEIPTDYYTVLHIYQYLRASQSF